MPKTTPREEIAHVGSRKTGVHLETRVRSNMNQTREAKGTDDLVHLLQAHRNEIRRVTEKVARTEVLKAHQICW